jgi:hypothetical protein
MDAGTCRLSGNRAGEEMKTRSSGWPFCQHCLQDELGAEEGPLTAGELFQRMASDPGLLMRCDHCYWQAWFRIEYKPVNEPKGDQ